MRPITATVNRGGRPRSSPRKRLLAVLVFRLDRRRQRQFQVANLERILVLAQGRVVGRRGNAETGRQAGIQEPSALQFLQARQVAQRLQGELRQESFRGSKGQ